MPWVLSTDSLSWSNGHTGKGYVLHNGTIKTWNVDPLRPTAQADIHAQNHELSPIALNFEIDPDGGVVTDQPSPKVEAIIAADPRLYDAGQRPVFEDDFDLAQFKPKTKPEGKPDYNFIMSAEAPLPIPMTRGCPRCHYPRLSDDGDPCPSCGYVIPYDGWEQMQGHDELGPVPGAGKTGWGDGGALDENDFPRDILGEPHFGAVRTQCPSCHEDAMMDDGACLHCGYHVPDDGWMWSEQTTPGNSGPYTLQHEPWYGEPKFGAWHLADYEGWSNWDTWHTALMMDNEEPTYNASRKLIERGSTVEQLRDWAIRKVLAPYNKQQIKDAQEWNAIPLEERQRRKRQHDIDQFGEAAVNMGDSLMQPFNDMQNEGKDEDEIRREQEIEAPELMDPELVNWDEIYQHLKSEQEGNDEYERDIQEKQAQGIGWATNHDDATNRMRDAYYRMHGAVPDEDLKAEGAGYSDPRAYHRITVQIPHEHMQQEGGWPDNYLPGGRDTLRDQIFKHRYQQAEAKAREELLGKGLSPEKVEEVLNDTSPFAPDPVRKHLPGGKYDTPINLEDPHERALYEADPQIQDIQQNGYTKSLSDHTWDTITDIRNGRPNPYIPKMQQALQQRGYTPEQIQQDMTPQWEWDPELNKMIPINREPDMAQLEQQQQAQQALDQPGDLTIPQEWTSRTAAPHTCPTCRGHGTLEAPQLLDTPTLNMGTGEQGQGAWIWGAEDICPDCGGLGYTPGGRDQPVGQPLQTSDEKMNEWGGFAHDYTHRPQELPPLGPARQGARNARYQALPGSRLRTGMAWPNELYHVSPAANREAIQQQGLMGHDRATPMFNPTGYGQGIPGNYAFDNLQDAQGYARIHGRQSPMDIWQINHSGSLPIEQDPEGPNIRGQHDGDYSHEDLRPEDFQRGGEAGDADEDPDHSPTWYWWGRPGSHEDEDATVDFGVNPIAWRIPAHVPPEQLQHHETITPEQIKAMPWQEHWMGDYVEGDDASHLAPDPYHRVHWPSPQAYQKGVQQFVDHHAPKAAAAVPDVTQPSPANELREWLADFGTANDAPSIHHDSDEDFIQAPAASTADDLPYYPPSAVPKELKQGMAERTGNPELDAAIAQFMLAHHEELGNIQDYRHPMVAWGRCEEVARACAEFLQSKGFNAQAESDELGAWGYEGAQPSEKVMTPEGQAGEFTYPEHCAVSIYNEHSVPWWTIDFTAAQYGFVDEFPKVEPGPPGPLIGPQADPDSTTSAIKTAEEDWPPSYYHLAPKELREQIRTEGLQPNKPHRWDDALGQPSGVYMFRNPDEADYWGWENLGDGHDRWEVTPPKDWPLVEDPKMGLYPSVYSPQPIPPEHLYLSELDDDEHHLLGSRTADSPINQADATNDPLGKNPAIVPSRQGDPDYLDPMPCPHCQGRHRPDEPCPDSSVGQYKQMERQWYDRDNNAIHASISDPFTCSSCGQHQLTEPYQLGNKMMQRCLACGITQQAPLDHPSIDRWNENFPQYPEALQEAGPQRAWVAATEADLFDQEEDPIGDWEDDGGQRKVAAAPDLAVIEMKESIAKLTAAVENMQKPGPTPEGKKPRKLVINRDANGKMESIEEV